MSDNLYAKLVSARSHDLAELRRTIDGIQGLAGMIGTAAQVVLVVDANVIIRDLIWMASKRRSPDAVPGLLESSVAGSLVACVPPYAIFEINDRIPFVARKRKIDEADLYRAWDEYRSVLRIEEPDLQTVAKYKQGRDPKDADYLALAETISAKGILSHDGDIAAMGGTVVSMEVVGLLRDYSRSAAIEFTIKVNGCMTLVVSAAVVRATFELVSVVVDKIRSLPAWVKGILLCALLVFLSNEKGRSKLSHTASTIRDSMEKLAPQIMQVVVALNSEHEMSKKNSKDFLDKILGVIESSAV